MKKTISKLMATAGALSLLASAIPFVGVSADEAAPFEYEKVEGGVVVTAWNLSLIHIYAFSEYILQ